MPVIDPQGLFDGDRLAACTDKAKLYWPFLYCASNGYARLEVNLNQIRRKCFSGFMAPATDSDIIEVLKEYTENFLVVLYAYNGKQWVQFDTHKKYLPRHKSKKDDESPAPSEEELLEFSEGYINWKSAKSLNLQLVRKISENFGKIREKCHGIGIGIGVGEGIGVGVGNPESTQTDFPENGQGEEMKAKKAIPTLCQQILHTKADMFPDTVAQIEQYAISTSNGQVIRQFEEWAIENVHEEFRGRPVAAFLRSLENPRVNEAKQAASDPLVVDLARELAYLSDGVVSFNDKEKSGLGRLLADGNTKEELVSIFRTFFADIQNDEFALKFAAKNFVEKADQLVYTARRKRSEKALQDAAVASKAAEMQAEAERERVERASAREKEQELVEDELPD